MTDRELMQQALDALNRSDYLGWQLNIPIIKALRERLAQPAQQQDIDWKDQYEKQKRRAEMWVAKYEADIGPLEKAGPVTAQQQEPVAWRYHGKLHEFDPSDWATGPVTPLYTSPPAKQWVNPSIKEYEDIMLANLTPRTDDERDGIMGALNDMVVLLKEKNT